MLPATDMLHQVQTSPTSRRLRYRRYDRSPGTGRRKSFSRIARPLNALSGAPERVRDFHQQDSSGRICAFAFVSPPAVDRGGSAQYLLEHAGVNLLRVRWGCSRRASPE
jgi:hypothetical protein